MKWWGSRRGRHSAASHSRTGGAKRGLIPGDALRRRGIGATAAAVLVSSALVTQGGITTDASWNDTEWAHAPAVGTSECGPDGAGFLNRAEGRALSGNLLGVNLDTLAEAEGVQVTNDGSTATATAGQPVTGIDSAFADPLTVNALSAIQLPLTGLLELPADNSTGVVGQFGQARSTGEALGASGYVDNSGGIDLADDQTGEYPGLATLRLSNLLNSPLLGDIGLGDTLSGVSDLELEVGAVAGQASFDTCAEAWGEGTAVAQRSVAASAAEDIVAGLDRRYLTASADLTFSSPTVGALSGELNNLLGGLEGTVNGLLGTQGVKTGIESGVANLLNAVLDNPLLTLGAIRLNTLTANIDLAPVRALIDTEFSDSGGVLTIDATAGTVSVDTSALLQQAYPDRFGDGLNGLPPNTNLLADEAILNALTQSLTGALTEWLSHVESQLVAAVDGIRITSTLSIDLRARLLAITPFIDVGHIAVSIDGTLAELRANKPGTVSTEVKLLSGLLGALTDLLTKGLLKPVLDLLLNTLLTGVGGVVSGVVDGVLPAVTGLPAKLTMVTAPLISLVSRLYNGLFLSNIVSITVNAQNAPATGGPPPPDWAPGQPTAPPEGQYEVAALRIGVLDGLGPNGVRLYLGRASVGPGCSPAEAAAGGCAGY
ncbi:choice-of-anchor G family protein [Leucobacter tenebrionis]|uniref:choice-of-anchor G family protein n=1 Tax=Leucobacter tenebrionis TaxID=2873270 RepID=UPI001CA7576C|nr:choice-of-anchor G family protein [Leucobacter tenebrionis]QZY50599.1 choice-of-anchor G family protein [Leucobacter tenebrionis]